MTREEIVAKKIKVLDKNNFIKMFMYIVMILRSL